MLYGKYAWFWGVAKVRTVPVLHQSSQSKTGQCFIVDLLYPLEDSI